MHESGEAQHGLAGRRVIATSVTRSFVFPTTEYSIVKPFAAPRYKPRHFNHRSGRSQDAFRLITVPGPMPASVV